MDDGSLGREMRQAVQDVIQNRRGQSVSTAACYRYLPVDVLFKLLLFRLTSTGRLETSTSGTKRDPKVGVR